VEGTLSRLPATNNVRKNIPRTHVAALRAAAYQGGVDAQFDLGEMYASGRGFPQDYVEAHKWYNLTGLDRATDRRDTLAKQMTPQQLAEAQKRAAEWQAAFEKRQAE